MALTLEKDSVEEFLAHHGVLGQKWGVRNEARKQRHLVKRNAKMDAKTFARIYKKGGSGSGLSLIKMNDMIQKKSQDDVNYGKTIQKELNKNLRTPMNKVRRTARGVLLVSIGATAAHTLLKSF